MAKRDKISEIDLISSELEKLNKQTAEYNENGEKKDKQRKTIIALCVVLAVIIIGAFIGAIVYIETQSPVSYGPNALAEEMTEERTKTHEERLKQIDENGGVREGVNFVGYYARFNDDGDLVIDGYIRNFTGHEIYDLEGNITVKTPEDENIGGAYFTFPVDEFGTLKNGKSRPWRLVFDNDYVNIEIVDLSKFRVITEFYFKH